MSTHTSNAAGQSTFRDAIRTAAQNALSASLILYLAATAASRAWVLLNSDVGHLIRRMH